MKKLKAIVAVVILIIIAIVLISIYNSDKTELVSIKTKHELKERYEGKASSSGKEIGLGILTMPYSILTMMDSGISESVNYKNSSNDTDAIGPSIGAVQDSASTLNSTEETTSKEYSTTNIQVENVDEADVTKTDGDYIYSISEDKVLITDVRNPEDLKIVATIEASNSSTVIPEELMLYQDKLAIIYTEAVNNTYYYNNNNNTIVRIYDIQNRETPSLLKEYTLYEPYYTSRCIDNKLYVISSGSLREEYDEIITYYREDDIKKEMDLENIKYLRDKDTNHQTLLSMVNLDNAKEEVKISSYLINIENAYIAKNNIYLLDQTYEGGDRSISSIFGLKGILGVFEEDSYESGYVTEIYKFHILEDGTIQYDTKTKEKGQTIDQFSLDEYQDHLRVALYDSDGSKVVVFDEKLQKIGETEALAKGEKMYSSRFIGEKVYLVTYKTIDPLYVIDLSTPTSPKVLGELKIPGYSTYLHPYDEDHLIGIGMQTEEVINRNSSGKVMSTTAKIVGMKMALFDVSDVNHPVQISDTIIGDSRTTSAILTNHKALLFSKEKELIAIPVNHYSEDFQIQTTSDNNYASMISSYKTYSKEYIAEGYFVYRINVTDGFELKGVINHEKEKSRYFYGNQSKLLRGMYIDDNLFTVSEGAIKVNRLDTLDLISELEIK